jgi:3'-phosphoadenosine 5'-phosphosulfate sulfotransferase (PAPS reductase)/FAD synthetase
MSQSPTQVLRVVSVSGGKDSTATYFWAVERFGKDGFRAVFADTGHEHPVTYNYLKNMHLMGVGGPKVEWVKADFSERLEKKGMASHGNPFLDLWLWKGRAPSARAQFCTEHLKLAPIRDWLNTFRSHREVEMYVGIRAGESVRRSKMPEEEESDFFDCVIKRPLLRWSEDDVFSFLEKIGVEANPLYANGWARVGCYPCIHSRKEELSNMPNWAWEKLAEWEKLAGRTWFSFGAIPLTQEQQLKLLEARGDLKALESLKNEFSPRVGDVREWAKTSRGGRQFGLFTEDAKDAPSCMSTWGVCE